LKPSVSIIVPVFDEAESIPELADRIVRACETEGISFEVWMVDDGSRDGSWKAIQRAHASDARFNGIRLSRNYGKSAALAVGFERASGTYTITLDADLQDDPAEIPGLLAMLDEGYDLVSGWKKTRRDPPNKRIPSRFFNYVTRLVSGIRLHDFNCGLKAYRTEVVHSVRLYGELHRYVPLLAKWEGFHRIGEKPVRHHPRRYGRTKFGFERFVRGFLDLITVLFLTRFAARPMHFFGTLGTLAFLGGFLIALWLSVEKLVFGLPIGNRPLLLLAALLIVVGTQTFLAGLLGEMVIVPRMERTSGYRIGETTADPQPQQESP
jgi:glycosyltransferase involved in cell wall biosynthesis